MSDLERFDLRPLLKQHAVGLRSTDADRLSWQTSIVLFWAPIAFGLVFPVTGARISGVGLSGLLAASGLLVGTMITSFVFLANLRIKVYETHRLNLNANLKNLISETAAGCLYVSFVSLILVSLSVLKLSFASVIWPDWLSEPHVWLSYLGTSLLLAVICHLLTTFITIIRRLYFAFTALFPE